MFILWLCDFHVSGVIKIINDHFFKKISIDVTQQTISLKILLCFLSIKL